MSSSVRCRPCQTRIAQKAMILQKRIIEGRGLTAQEARARWVANNPDLARSVNNKARQKKKELIDRYKAERGCEDCGTTDRRVLDLHHRDADDKVESVSVLRRRASRAAILAEASKCDVLCANCHRIRHADETDERRAAAESETQMADIQMTTGAFFRAT